jgi:hypothetical protein
MGLIAIIAAIALHAKAVCWSVMRVTNKYGHAQDVLALNEIEWH